MRTPITLRRVEDDDDDLDRKRKRMVRDGEVVRVPFFLMDATMPPDVAREAQRISDRKYDGHRPHQACVTDSKLADARQAATDARNDWIDKMSGAYRTAPQAALSAPDPSAAPPADDGKKPDPEAARQKYLLALNNAWQTPGARPGL